MLLRSKIAQTRRGGKPHFCESPVLGLAIAALLAAGLGSALPAVPASGAAAAVLVAWPASQPGSGCPSDPEWTVLHRFHDAMIGLLPSDSPDLGAARVLGPFDDGHRYALISLGTMAELRAGSLPAAWRSAFALAGREAPDRATLASVAPLAQDGAVALVALPEALAPIALEPGGRVQLLRSPSSPATRRPSVSPEPIPGGPIAGWPIAGWQRDPALWTALAAGVRADRMTADLDYLATELRTRHSYTPQMELACDHAKAAFEALGYATWFDPFTYAGHSLKNVVAVKPGALDPDRIFVVGGHLDSTSPEPQTLAPGADDNGSGAAAVIEIARLLAPVETDYTLYFICFSAEEQGLVGSEHFAAQAALQGLDIRAVLTMDMTAYHDPAGSDLWIEGFYSGATSIWLMDMLESIAAGYAGLTVYRYPSDGFGSDHVPFHDHGYPAVLSIENEWDSNPCYHRTCDRVDRLDPWLWSRITAANAIAAGQLAQVRDPAGSIAGQVTVAGGGDPTGTELRLAGTGHVPLVCAGGGHFAWDAVFPGRYTLEATKAGCLPVSMAVEVLGGATAAPEIVLEPSVAGAISGVVRAPDGAPLPDALIEIEGQGSIALSGPDGAYTLAPAWPGELRLAASLPDRLPRGIALNLPQGGTAAGIDFVLSPIWDFEVGPESLLPGLEWAHGSDALAGAHSGTRVWGTALGATHAHCADDRLELPPFSLAHFSQAALSLWTWYQAESGDDGGHLSISTDGGRSWQVVQPDEGYDAVLDGTCNPLDGEAAFTGSSGAWVRRTFRLDDFAGDWVRARLHFGSDRSVAQRGWYVDDFTFLGVRSASSVEARDDRPSPTGPDPGGGARGRARLSARPSPARSATLIRLELPDAQSGALGIFALDGRRLAVLEPWTDLAPGPHIYTWTGRDDQGRNLPTGVYWVRWTAPGAESRARLLLVR